MKNKNPRDEEKREAAGGLLVLILGAVLVYFISVNLGG